MFEQANIFLISDDIGVATSVVIRDVNIIGSTLWNE